MNRPRAAYSDGGDQLNPAYISIFALWIIIFATQRRQRKTILINTIIKKRKTGGNKEMKELAAKFIGKECVICFFDGGQQMGIIKEVTEGAILMEKKDKLEAVNLDFVLRIKEAPKSKK